MFSPRSSAPDRLDRAVYSISGATRSSVWQAPAATCGMSVARDLVLSNGPVRQSVRRLNELVALRLLERSKTAISLRCACRSRSAPSAQAAMAPLGTGRAAFLLPRGHGLLENLGAPQKPFTSANAAPAFTTALRPPRLNLQCLAHVVAPAPLRFGRNS